MKIKKAAGIDGISMEAWKYGGKAIKRGLTTLVKKNMEGRSVTRGLEKRTDCTIV